MISRAALNSFVWRSIASRKCNLNAFALNKRLQSNVAAPGAADVSASIAGEESEKPAWEKFPINEMINPYPNPPQVVTQKFDNMSDLLNNDQSIQEMLSIKFGRDMPTIKDDESPERDTVNFPSYVRPVEAPKTRMANLVPEEFFQFFYQKTGVTGPYIFTGGLITFLFSKEYLIFEHELVVGVGLAFWTVFFLKKIGQKLSNTLEDTVRQEENGWLRYQNDTKKILQDYIEANKKYQDGIRNQSILFDAKRENIHLQYEEEYRNRLMKVYEQCKRKLDYQISLQEAQKSFAQKHMVQWIIDNVNKSITAEQEKLALTNAISELKDLASRRAGAI